MQQASLRYLLQYFNDGRLGIPDYQRAACWTEVQQAAFLGFVLEGGPCPAFYVREVTDSSGTWRDELVDGQQRLLAFRAWTEHRVPAVLPTRGRSLWCRGAPGGEMDRTMSAPVARFSSTRAEAIAIYLALNSGGTPHTQEELVRARAKLEEELACGTGVG